MSMLDWAKREVAIASKRERGDQPEGEWNYGVACYESALKAYKALLDDEHSGYSWSVTVGILNRLCNNKPLTPIEDTDDVWTQVGENEYQCKRMYSLFKSVADDGTVTYHDNDRICCVDLDTGSTYHNGLVRNVVNETYPIKMPYMPDKSIKVFCEDFLTDEKNGDFDTKGIFYLIKPNGARVEINRFFKESNSKWEEITSEEYIERKSIRVDKS